MREGSGGSESSLRNFVSLGLQRLVRKRMTLLTFTRLPSGLRGQNANQPFGTLAVPASPQDEDFNLALGVGLSHLEHNFELPFEPREKDSAWTCGEWKIPEGLRGAGAGCRDKTWSLGARRRKSVGHWLTGH